MKKTVLITGASSGIGLALAKEFARNNFILILTARNEKALTALKNEIESNFKSEVYVIPQDLEEKHAGEKLFSQIKGFGLSIDILVNNAGFGDFGPFSESAIQKQENMVQVNITALMELTRLCLPDMRAKKEGRILNVASVAAFQPGPYMSVYYATKAFVLSFSEAIAEELVESGISVTALCPGPVATGFEKAADLEHSRLFQSFRAASAENVAAYGYNALMSGKVIAVYGWQNKLLLFFERFVPRFAVRKITKLAQKQA